MINSPFRYPGGKSKANVRKQILAYMPHKTKEFREPFVGGGGVFFGLDPTKVQRRWINDINPSLISVYEAFRDRPEEFLRACRAIEPSRAHEPQVSTKTADGKKYNQRLGKIFEEFAANPNMDPALRYYFINRTVWGGRVNYEMKSRLYYSNPTGWNIVERPQYLESVADHLQGTRITCSSYQDLLSEDGDDVWIYLDPPYLTDTDLSRGSKLYEKGFALPDHQAFAVACGATKHKICISYDDQSWIRSLFPKNKGFFIYEHSWKYCGSSQKIKEDGQELIITNYERPGHQAPLFEEFPMDICAE